MSRTLGTNRAFYILLAVSLLLLFLVIRLFTKITPLASGHILYDCKEALEGLAITLPHSFPSLFILVLSGVVLIGILLLGYQYYKTRAFLNSILRGKTTTPKKIKDLISELGIKGKVIIVKDSAHSSFCYGLIFPKICLSLKLVNTLTRGELKAVLIHESYHLKNSDPLKILLSRVAVSTFFFVPILKDFYNYYSLSKELSADKLVVKSKSLTDLKSALSKALNNLIPNVNGVAAFAGADSLEQRVTALAAPHYKPGVKISFIKMAISIIVLSVAFGTLGLPIHAMENPDGTHSYYIMSQEDMQIASCLSENTTAEFPFSSEESFSPLNYSPKQ